MAQPWLDDLSEEWVPQEPASASASLKKNLFSASLQSQNSVSNQRSRLPRPRHSSQYSKMNGEHEVSDAPRCRNALSERSLSDNNVLPSPSGTQEKQTRQGMSIRSISAISAGSVIHNDTVECGSVSRSPTKGLSGQNVPEWRRRLLQGEMSYKDQKDLFSGMGLENMFQQQRKPATLRGKSMRNKLALNAFGNMPSSPPPWLGSQHKQLPHVQPRSQVDNSDVDALVNSLLIEEQREEKQEEEQRGDGSVMGSDSIAQLADCTGFANKTHATVRTTSGQTDLHNESFSPVFVSKHNTVDGRVDYAALDSSRSRREVVDQQQVGKEAFAKADVVRGLDTTDIPDLHASSHLQLEDDTLPESLPAGTPDVAEIGPFVNVRRGGCSDDGSFRRRPLSPSIPQSVAESDSPNSGFAASRDPRSTRRPPAPTPPEDSRLVHKPYSTRFGSGQLDGYTFSDELSLLSHENQEQQSEASQSPPSYLMPPGAQAPFKFRRDDDQLACGALKRVLEQQRSSPKASLHVAKRGSVKSCRAPSGITAEEAEESGSFADDEFQGKTEGKRPRTSPMKGSTPKRRRTLLTVETQVDVGDVSVIIKERPAYANQNSSRKRKTTRHESSSNIADPKILSQRQILRPRNPTPSQRRRQEIQAEVLEATEEFLKSSHALEAIEEQLTSPTPLGKSVDTEQARTVAGQVAAFSMRMAKHLSKDGRKPSMTTNDYLNEAAAVMEYIRRRVRPNSGLGNVEESPSEDTGPEEEEDNDPINSRLSFSRPPTREGVRSGWRSPGAKDLDARVVSQLKRFEEKDDDDFMASSLQVHTISPQIKVRHPSQESFANQVDDTCVIRESQQEDEEYGNTASPTKSHKSQPSTDSMGQTIGTSSSKRSDHVATLAPEAVAHLIPDQVGAMSFDKERGIWIKAKSPKKHSKPAGEVSTIHESDDDPFNDIPDLTVDELREATLHFSPPKQSSVAHADLAIYPDTQSISPQQSSIRDFRPPTSEGAKPIVPNISSARTGFADVSSPQPHIETRATSWSDQTATTNAYRRFSQPEEVENINEQPAATSKIQYPNDNGPGIHISKGEDRTFSGIHTTLDSEELPDDEISAPSENVASRIEDIRECYDFPSPPISRSLRKPPHYHNSQRTPPKSMRFSVSVSGPLTFKHTGHSATVQTLPAPKAYADVTFLMSDLPDFTIDQIDEREVSNRTLVKRQGQSLVTTTEDRYGLGTAELVRALQDAAPEEPYWEDLRKIDLRERQLPSLHQLGDLCWRLERLDVSGNHLTQLRGAPPTIRWLKADNNQLTSLTSWTHLPNLQYLDVSHNDLESLESFSELIHLRELVADNNHVQSANGIFGNDGLIRLSLRNNELTAVDFAGAHLRSLAVLDLSGNGLSAFKNLQYLPELKQLDLDDNDLNTFNTSSTGDIGCSELTSLVISRNKLEVLDVRSFLSLKQLNADSNFLESIDGVEKLSQLTSISARGQICSTKHDSTALINTNADLHNLYLSSNSIPSLAFHTEFLNLQSLELSATGLQRLPEMFGQQAPNVRVLNLNFNRLDDLRPLLNIKRLTTLLVAGNRVSRLRKSLAVLSKLSSLTKLDLRDNPLTVGFYAPVVETRLVRRAVDDPPSDLDPHTLPYADKETDQQYASRLDEDTMLKRKVYEMMLANACVHLQSLDGLPFCGDEVLTKDGTWDRLIDLGVVRKSKHGSAQ